MDDCIFCKIVKGDIPSSKIYEDKDVLAFMDIVPVNQGHCLVIPKKHYEDILSTPDEELAKTMKVAKKVAHAVMEATSAQGFNLGVNNRKAAGQVVFHTHVHIMPRFQGDGLKLWPGKPADPKELRQLAGKIESHLK